MSREQIEDIIEDIKKDISFLDFLASKGILPTEKYIYEKKKALLFLKLLDYFESKEND